MAKSPNDIIDAIRRTDKGPAAHVHEIVKMLDQLAGSPSDARIASSLGTMFVVEMLVYLLANSTTTHARYIEACDVVVDLIRKADPDTQRPPKGN